METIRERTIRVFKEVFDQEDLEIRDETSPDQIEDWDSLSHINLVVSIEKEFNIRFLMHEVPDLTRFGKIIEEIKKKYSSSQKSIG